MQSAPAHPACCSQPFFALGGLTRASPDCDLRFRAVSGCFYTRATRMGGPTCGAREFGFHRRVSSILTGVGVSDDKCFVIWRARGRFGPLGFHMGLLHTGGRFA